jgi:LuxR family maltose regulon positive regulatory protein
VLQGRLSQAEVTLQKARLIAVGPDGKPLALVGIADNVFGDILRERNRLDEAKEYLERGHQLTQTEWLLNSLDSLVSLARLLQSRGEWDEAQALIAEAFRLSLGTKASPWDEVFIAATAVRLALQRDDRTAAHRWWEQNRLHELQPEAYPYHVLEYLQLTQARYYLTVGQDAGDKIQLHRVLELLQSLLPQAEQFKRATSEIEILVLRARVEAALGEADQAVQTLLSALALGEAEEYRRIYLDEGRVMADLLARCRETQLQSDRHYPSLQYIESLLKDCQREAGIRLPASTAGVQDAAATRQTQHEPAVLLSTREMEVLTLIAAGKTNQEIAEQLYLALNTVKRHAYNIYAKLDVKKRTQAVVEARRLGLIP